MSNVPPTRKIFSCCCTTKPAWSDDYKFVVSAIESVSTTPLVCFGARSCAPICPNCHARPCPPTELGRCPPSWWQIASFERSNPVMAPTRQNGHRGQTGSQPFSRARRVGPHWRQGSCFYRETRAWGYLMVGHQGNPRVRVGRPFSNDLLSNDQAAMVLTEFRRVLRRTRNSSKRFQFLAGRHHAANILPAARSLVTPRNNA
jgi:hypothetical protein